MTSDVLVVVGGGAGLRAAIAVAETHPELRVPVISKLYPMRSHAVSAERGGGDQAGGQPRRARLRHHLGGDWLCDQVTAEVFAKEASEEMLRLEYWSYPWSREPDGRIAVRPFGGTHIERTCCGSSACGSATMPGDQGYNRARCESVWPQASRHARGRRRPQ
ncbi:MAG: FAD-binding protein [Candidatus Rokuibacteriota bacterium]